MTGQRDSGDWTAVEGAHTIVSARHPGEPLLRGRLCMGPASDGDHIGGWPVEKASDRLSSG